MVEAGEPVFGIEERVVPQSNVPGERSSPTQPIPVRPPPIAKVEFSPEDIVTAQDTTANAAGFGAVTKADAVKSIAANTADVMGPFPTTAFNNPSGQIVVSYSSVTDLDVAAVRVSGAT